MSKPKITAHMVVKNEDQWVWYAINSILPFVDTLLITDTGSTDQTLKLINSINSPKIRLTTHSIHSPSELTQVRNAQLDATLTDWVWIIDGDEIYPQSVADECVKNAGQTYSGIVVRRYDLLGDIYHRQIESVGTYDLFGKKGHHLIRLFNKSKFPGLKYEGVYPNEDLVFKNNQSLRDTLPEKWYFTSGSIYHAMYLKRSSINSHTFNRGKFKIETGMALTSPPPEIFSSPHPLQLIDPLAHRSISYDLAAGLITPIKKLKRKLI